MQPSLLLFLTTVLLSAGNWRFNNCSPTRMEWREVTYCAGKWHPPCKFQCEADAYGSNSGLQKAPWPAVSFIPCRNLMPSMPPTALGSNSDIYTHTHITHVSFTYFSSILPIISMQWCALVWIKLWPSNDATDLCSEVTVSSIVICISYKLNGTRFWIAVILYDHFGCLWI